jgi:hypothetical protein
MPTSSEASTLIIQHTWHWYLNSEVRVTVMVVPLTKEFYVAWPFGRRNCLIWSGEQQLPYKPESLWQVAKFFTKDGNHLGLQGQKASQSRRPQSKFSPRRKPQSDQTIYHSGMCLLRSVRTGTVPKHQHTSVFMVEWRTQQCAFPPSVRRVVNFTIW